MKGRKIQEGQTMETMDFEIDLQLFGGVMDDWFGMDGGGGGGSAAPVQPTVKQSAPAATMSSPTQENRDAEEAREQARKRIKRAAAMNRNATNVTQGALVGDSAIGSIQKRLLGN